MARFYQIMNMRSTYTYTYMFGHELQKKTFQNAALYVP